MIRVIAGEYRHREVTMPQSASTRPTQDRIREALFSALGFEVGNRCVLDLFAGSGALGFEALSRGAHHVTLVDSSSECIQAIQKTVSNFKCADKVTVIKADAGTYLKTAQTTFSLVFLDPPYEKRINHEIIKLMVDSSLVTDDVVIVCEQDYDIDDIESFVLRRYRYGQKRIGIYRRKV